jgi:hypothetical protein
MSSTTQVVMEQILIMVTEVHQVISTLGLTHPKEVIATQLNGAPAKFVGELTGI